jgi:hypothetical protein
VSVVWFEMLSKVMLSELVGNQIPSWWQFTRPTIGNVGNGYVESVVSSVSNYAPGAESLT